MISRGCFFCVFSKTQEIMGSCLLYKFIDWKLFNKFDRVVQTIKKKFVHSKNRAVKNSRIFFCFEVKKRKQMNYCVFTLTKMLRLRSSAFQPWCTWVSRDAGGMSSSTSRRAGLEKSWASARGTTGLYATAPPPPTPTPPPVPAPLSRVRLFKPPETN